MKKITAMLIALTMAALTLTGCSNDESSSSAAGQNVSGLSSESEAFTTTATLPKTITDDDGITYIFDEDTQLYLPVKTDTESTTEEVIIHRSSPHIEELLVGILNAIGSHNEEEYNTYIAPENRNHKRYSYEAVHGQFVEALYNAGFDHKAIYTYEDFLVYDYAGYAMYFKDNPSIITFEIAPSMIRFDLDTEYYSIMGMPFYTYEYGDKNAKKNGALLDLTAYATEVTE